MDEDFQIGFILNLERTEKIIDSKAIDLSSTEINFKITHKNNTKYKIRAYIKVI